MARDDEARQSGSMSMQDLPGYREAADSEAFRKARAVRPARAPRIRVQQRWIVTCETCGAIEDPFEFQREADEAKQQHLGEHARDDA